MWKENLNVCLKCFYKFARRKGGTYCKIPSTKSITAAIDRYLRSLPHHKPFSNISDHEFTEANSVLDIFAKDLEKQSLEKQSRKSSWRNYLRAVNSDRPRAWTLLSNKERLDLFFCKTRTWKWPTWRDKPITGTEGVKAQTLRRLVPTHRTRNPQSKATKTFHAKKVLREKRKIAISERQKVSQITQTYSDSEMQGFVGRIDHDESN